MDDQLQQFGAPGDDDAAVQARTEPEDVPERLLVWNSMDLPGMDRAEEYD